MCAGCAIYGEALPPKQLDNIVVDFFFRIPLAEFLLSEHLTFLGILRESKCDLPACIKE